MLRGGEGNLIQLRDGNQHPCPRCNSQNTKFCYYNNYSHSQPRHFCKNCRRYWTRGGTQRNVPVGGGHRRFRRHRNPPAVANPPPRRRARAQAQNQPGQLNPVPAPATAPSNAIVSGAASTSLRGAENDRSIVFSAPIIRSIASASSSAGGSAMQYQVGGFVPSLAPIDQTFSQVMNIAGDFGVTNWPVLQGFSFSFPSFNRQPPQENTSNSGGLTWPGGSGLRSNGDHPGGGLV